MNDNATVTDRELVRLHAELALARFRVRAAEERRNEASLAALAAAADAYALEMRVGRHLGFPAREGWYAGLVFRYREFLADREGSL